MSQNASNTNKPHCEAIQNTEDQNSLFEASMPDDFHFNPSGQFTDDDCSFPVSVTDKLPTQVMEMDDEEPSLDDISKEPTIDSVSYIHNLFASANSHLSTTGQEHVAPSQSNSSGHFSSTSCDYKKDSDKLLFSPKDSPITSALQSVDTPSQPDLFTNTEEYSSFGVTVGQRCTKSSYGLDSLNTPIKDLPNLSQASTTPKSSIFSVNIEKDSKVVPYSPISSSFTPEQTPETQNNRKRKNESQDSLSAGPRKVAKSPDIYADDPEILASGKSPADRSIEVIYQNSEFATGTQKDSFAPSQDLRLFLSEDLTASSQKLVETSFKSNDTQISSSSRSLLSMPESDRLSCLDAFSSFEDRGSAVKAFKGSSEDEISSSLPLRSHSTLKASDKNPLDSPSLNLHCSGRSGSANFNNGLSKGSSPELLNVSSQSPILVQSQSPALVKDIVSCPEFSTPSGPTPEDTNSQSLFYTALETPKQDLASNKSATADSSILSKSGRAPKSNVSEDSNAPATQEDDSPIILDHIVSKVISHTAPINTEKPKQFFKSSHLSGSFTSKYQLTTPGSESKREGDSPKILSLDSDEDNQGSCASLYSKSKNSNAETPEKKCESVSKKTDVPASIPNNVNDKCAAVSDDKNSPEVIPLGPEVNGSDTLSSNDTEEVAKPEIKCVSDIFNAGLTYVGKKSFVVECWVSANGHRSFVLVGQDKVFPDSTSIGSLFSMASANFFRDTSSSSSNNSLKNRRFSDVSTISKVSSTGYIPDGSSSGSLLLESTRLSDSSTSNGTKPALTNNKYGKSEGFLAPAAIENASENAKVEISIDTDSNGRTSSGEGQITHKVANLSTSGDEYTSQYLKTRRPKSSTARKRGRPKGYKATPTRRKKGTLSEDVIDEVKQEQPPLSPRLPALNSETGTKTADAQPNDITSLFSDSLREKYVNSRIPNTDDETEIMKKYQEDSKAGFELEYSEMINRTRIAEIEPNALVFARYVDGRYYSATVKKRLKDDKWRIEFNLDKYSCEVRDVFIIPTATLSKGTFCYAQDKNSEFSSFGRVVGHPCYDEDASHWILLDTGHVEKFPHRNLIVSSEVAEEILEPRRNHLAITESPGGEVSLRNVIPTKLRDSKKSASPSLRIKPDPVLDSSDRDSAKTPNKKYSKIPTKYSESSESSSDVTLPSNIHTLLKTPKRTPSSQTKKRAKKISRTPKSSSKKAKNTTLESVEESAPEVSQRNDVPDPASINMNPRVEIPKLSKVGESSKPASSSQKRPSKGTRGRTPKKYIKVSAPNHEPEIESDPRLGPLPPPGCDIFSGYTILVTCAKECSDSMNISCAHDSKEIPEIVPFDRDHLCRQLLLGGGCVAESFDEAYRKYMETLPAKKGANTPSSSGAGGSLFDLQHLPAAESPLKVLCLSNAFCRTEKYIQCLTVGIPLVNTNWVLSSLRTKRCLNWSRFLLPAGVSLLTQELMEQVYADKNVDVSQYAGKVVDVLRNEKVFLASSKDPNFGNFWLPLLIAAQASVFKTPLDGSGNLNRLIDRKTLVVVADASLPDVEAERARRVNVPVVSSEWFIQSLIARCRLPFRDHPAFAHDHKPPLNA